MACNPRACDPELVGSIQDQCSAMNTMDKPFDIENMMKYKYDRGEHGLPHWTPIHCVVLLSVDVHFFPHLPEMALQVPMIFVHRNILSAENKL